MNKNLVRYLVIIMAGFLIAFLAKMGAINFLLAVSVGVMVTIFAYQYQAKVNKTWSGRDHQSLHWFLAFVLGLFLELYIWPIYFILPLLAGIFSGYLVYSALNALFISP
jgi:hypothetical protein